MVLLSVVKNATMNKEVKDIKNAIWFIRESKKFTGYGYFRMLFKENLIGKTIWFCKEMNE